MCYDELIQKNVENIGETLYTEHFFFCNTSEIIDVECQNRIKEYTYCKASNTSPYSDLQKTPANYIDQFMMIENELKKIKDKG
jgi:hypothetical protein